MVTLHEALKSLGPCDWTDIPTDPQELEQFMTDLFSKSQVILESVPIADPDEALRSRSHTVSSVASNASEMSSSSARSAPPPSEYMALQKEWGKAVKLSAKENPLHMSVYKLGGKDGRGAWFARRSVHEGLSFARFKRGLEREFPESLAVQGAPGEGNIRGIGGEKKLESIKIGNKGKVEVYHLSAQFPGPTTPRDFVTFLVTSSKAMKDGDNTSKVPELSPRHYMIISKPCSHPATPAGKDGMIRGSYESVEFIREVPQVPKKTQSSIDLTHVRNASGSESLEKSAILRNAENKPHPFPLEHPNKSQEDISDHHRQHSKGRSTSSSPGRKRSVTVDEPVHKHGHGTSDEYDPEENPVEWIMITRSDPGGSVPRFMVERGTPSSIVADASKFLNWATSKKHPADEEDAPPPARPDRLRQSSYQSYHGNGHLDGITEQDTPIEPPKNEPFPDLSQPPSPVDSHKHMQSSGILASVTGAATAMLGTYAPQTVVDHLPGSDANNQAPALPHADSAVADVEGAADDAASTISSTSFQSADSHIGEDEGMSPSISSKSSPEKDPSASKTQLSPHEKELEKLNKRRATLDTKLQSARDKLAKDSDQQTEKEKEAMKKAEEKHAKELQKQEEKYKKEVAKLEEKKEREAKKLEEKKKRAADKDEKARISLRNVTKPGRS